MLSCNLWTERGLVNGSMGTVAAILYRSGGPPDLSVAVMVQFDKYSGPTWGGDRCVTISSVTRTWRSGHRELSRQLLPLRLAWAVTVHKSQGLTLDQAVIDIGKKHFSTGLSFVVLSLVRKLQDCLIQQFTFDRLKNLSKNKNINLRKNEEKRLAALGIGRRAVQATAVAVGVNQSLPDACRPLSQPLPTATRLPPQTAMARPARAPKGQSYYQQARDQLRHQNRLIIHIGGRGDCLLKCISQALMDTQLYHRTYREKIIDIMIGRDAMFAPYVDGDYDKHLGNMRKQGTWGTDAEIMVAATLFGIDIRVFYRGGDQWEWHTHDPLFAFQLPMEVAVDRIELVNYDRQHYDLVVSLPGSGSKLEVLQVPEDCVPSLPS